MKSHHQLSNPSPIVGPDRSHSKHLRQKPPSALQSCDQIGQCQPLPAVYRGLESAPEADDWIEKLQGTDVVGAPGEFKPLILDERGRLYLRRYWEYEKRLADIIKARLKAARPAVNIDLLRQGLARFFPNKGETNWQKVAAFTAVISNFCVITGGPGTGKTRTVAAILALLLEQAGNGRFALLFGAKRQSGCTLEGVRPEREGHTQLLERNQSISADRRDNDSPIAGHNCGFALFSPQCGPSADHSYSDRG